MPHGYGLEAHALVRAHAVNRERESAESAALSVGVPLVTHPCVEAERRNRPIVRGLEGSPAEGSPKKREAPPERSLSLNQSRKIGWRTV